jgi:hypothetical protein
MRALVALMVAVLLALGGASLVDATTGPGCHIDVWPPMPRNVCPISQPIIRSLP